MQTVYNIIIAYVIAYPSVMAIFWLIGTIVHYIGYEREFTLTNYEYPKVSILVPCYNEEDNVEEIIYRLDNLNYDNYEIIAINDGSADNTLSKLNALGKIYERLRVVNSVQNKGKANALHLGFLSASGEILVGVDADAYIDKEALNYLVPHFLAENNKLYIGAVTGNPRVRNRRNLLSKIQMGEFSSIVGMIKRTQQLNYTAMTVSGVIVAFRREALIDVGLWDKDMITEDIAVTWKLHSHGWGILYEPRAICWMLVPEKLPSLFKQRYRWSQGGIEVLYRHIIPAFKRGDWRNLPLLLEQICGIIWAYCWLIATIVAFYIFFTTGVYELKFQRYFLFFISLAQFLVAILIEYRYDEKFFRTYLWVIWYPQFYWVFNAIVICRAFFETTLKKIFSPHQKFATWESPDRGDTGEKRVDIDLDIASKIDLTQNLTPYKKSIFAILVTVIISLFFWFWYLSDLTAFAKYIYQAAHSDNILVIEKLFTFQYKIFFYVAFVFIVFWFFIATFIYFFGEFYQTDKHFEVHDTDKEEAKFFNIEEIEVKEIKTKKYNEFEGEL